MNLAVYLKIGALSFVTLDSLAIEMYPSPMKKKYNKKNLENPGIATKKFDNLSPAFSTVDWALI
jgi:hypothetical protein